MRRPFISRHVLQVFLIVTTYSGITIADAVRLTFYAPMFHGKSIGTEHAEPDGTIRKISHSFDVTAMLIRNGDAVVAVFETPIAFRIEEHGGVRRVTVDRLLIPSGETANQLEKLAPLTSDQVVLRDFEINEPDLELQKQFGSMVEKVGQGGQTLYRYDGKLWSRAEIDWLGDITKTVTIKHPFTVKAIILDQVDFAEASGGVVAYHGKVRTRLEAIYTAEGGTSYRGTSTSVLIAPESVLEMPRFPLNSDEIQQKIQFLRNQVIRQNKPSELIMSRLLRENGIDDEPMPLGPASTVCAEMVAKNGYSNCK